MKNEDRLNDFILIQILTAQQCKTEYLDMKNKLSTVHVDENTEKKMKDIIRVFEKKHVGHFIIS